MTLALARSLVAEGRCHVDACAAAYAADFQSDRGYAAATIKVMEALRGGAAASYTGLMGRPEGSYGNGGAMRIAPVGLAYRHASTEARVAAVEAALLCTHVHPDGVDGAAAQAHAVAALSLSVPSGAGPAGSPGALLQLLALVTRKNTAMHRKLLDLKEALFRADGAEDRPSGASNWEGDVASPLWKADLEVLQGVATMANQAHACEAVACALWALCRHWHHPQAAIIAAARYGGDPDTLAAITGALAGALHGTFWVPADWWEGLEMGPGGRDDVVTTAAALAALNLSE